jgi:hypothetical protein
MDTNYDEIRAKAEALAEDAFWGSQDEGSLTSGIISLVTDEVERKMREATAGTYSCSTPAPPEDVTLLLDESDPLFPFLHRVGDLWRWSHHADREAVKLSYRKASSWTEATKHTIGTLTVVPNKEEK